MPAQRLDPRFSVDETDVILVTQFLAAAPDATLGPVVENIDHCRDDIVNAPDMLFIGF